MNERNHPDSAVKLLEPGVSKSHKIPPLPRRRVAIRSLLPNIIATALITAVGWQALQHSGSLARSAVIVACLVAVAAILIRQEISVRESRRLTSDLSHQIDRDPLTGLLNLRRIGRRIDDEIAQAKASGRALGIALIDVDDFKVVNDTRGHSSGDQVLKSIAGILSGASRDSDIVARYGGDEFLLVLPGLDLGDAHIVGERLMREVARYSNTIAPTFGKPITVSVGIAVSRQCLRSAWQLIAIADAAMYDAKDAGKNQFVIVDADMKILDIEGYLRAARDEEFVVDEILTTAG